MWSALKSDVFRVPMAWQAERGSASIERLDADWFSLPAREDPPSPAVTDRVGEYNALTEGCWLWPIDGEYEGIRIRIGNRNYFNRDVMIDACGHIEIGSHNMFGPGVYITDSNHTLQPGQWVGQCPMDVGRVIIETAAGSGLGL